MKKILFTIVIGMTLLIPSASFAAEEKFFEFATDVGVPIAVPTGSIAIQEFKSYNDYISGVDIWFDNTGSSGSVTIALLDTANNVLASKAVTAVHADPFYAGRQLHAKFTTAAAVTSGSWYKIRVTSSTPNLRVYGIKRIQFVEHDAPYPITSAIGESLLNGESQNAVFKFALYEETDLEAPIITNASSTIAGTDAVRIAFNASELADRMITYTVIGSGFVSTVNYTGNYSVCFEGISLCTVTIDTQRDALYTYRLTVRDSWGNEAYVDGAFESWKPGTVTPPADPTTPPTESPTETPPPTTPPPAPLAITNGRVTSVTGQSVQIAWDTDRAANSSMIISADPVGSQIVSSAADGTYELAHLLQTGKGLGAGSDYYATIISRDELGVMDAEVIPFTTTGATTPPTDTTTPPTPPATPLQTYVSQDQQTASLTWGTPAGGEPANGYRIDIIDERGNLFRTMRVASGEHSVEATGLNGGEYRVVAYADNEGVVEKIAPPATIVVRKRAEPIDTYALIKKPIVYIPSALFVLLIAGLYWYSKRAKKIIPPPPPR